MSTLNPFRVGKWKLLTSCVFMVKLNLNCSPSSTTSGAAAFICTAARIPTVRQHNQSNAIYFFIPISFIV